VHGSLLCSAGVPGRSGLPGNEAAVAEAKPIALQGTLTSDRALDSDVGTFLHCAVLSSWQDEWANTRQQIARCEAFRAEVAYLFLRRQEGGGYADTAGNSSHTSHTLRGEPDFLCVNCDAPPTVPHILTDAIAKPARRLYHLHGTLSDTLRDERRSVSNVAFFNAVGLSTPI
jgi:hypothetical protein